MTAINNKQKRQMVTAESMDQALMQRDQSKEIHESNKVLSEAVARQESKNAELNEKILKLKVYSKCYKHSMASQCKFCHSFYPIEMFIDHIKNCSKDMNNFSRNHFFQMKLECFVKDTYIMEDPLDHRTYTEYSI